VRPRSAAKPSRSSGTTSETGGLDYLQALEASRPDGVREALGVVLSGKMPSARAFAMPNATHTAAMLRADLGAARDAWLAEADF